MFIATLYFYNRCAETFEQDLYYKSREVKLKHSRKELLHNHKNILYNLLILEKNSNSPIHPHKKAPLG